MWTWWASLTFLSLAIKIFPLYAAACTAGWCLPPWNTLGINLLQKQIADSEICAPAQALAPLLPGADVCPWLGTPFVFWQIKTSLLPQWKENFNEVLGDLLHSPLKCKFTQGWRLFWKSGSKKVMPLSRRWRKQPVGYVKMPVPLINIDWVCSEENAYIMCCGWGDVEIQAGIIRQVSVRAVVTVVFLFGF